MKPSTRRNSIYFAFILTKNFTIFVNKISIGVCVAVNNISRVRFNLKESFRCVLLRCSAFSRNIFCNILTHTVLEFVKLDKLI